MYLTKQQLEEKIQQCPQRDEFGICGIITTLSSIQTTPTPEECRLCLKCIKPSTVNESTILISNKIRLENDLSQLHSPEKGPGTRLKNVIDWIAKPTPGCNCEDRVSIMNAWGKEGCRENIHTILSWLRESARIHEIPFSESIVRTVINIILY